MKSIKSSGNNRTNQPQALGIGNPKPEEPYNLPGAEAEIKRLPELLPGSEYYLRQEATLENFRLQAPRFPYLHLATHGCFEAEGCCLGEKEECQGVRRINMQPNTLLFADQTFNIADAALLGMEN
ncbi:MAG: CHAT domain-containing protein [Coleofasciculaceae cyanobacterium]